MTSNDAEASHKKAEDAPTNPYKTLFFVTAPITAILAGACVWMGVQLSSTSPASQATPAATPTAAADAANAAAAAEARRSDRGQRSQHQQSADAAERQRACAA